MQLIDLRRLLSMLALLDDDTPVSIDFGGYTMDDDYIESIEICNDRKSVYVNLGIGGRAYKSECEEGIVEMDELKRSAIENALLECGYNKEKAAKKLGISSRTIYRKMKQYGIMED